MMIHKIFNSLEKALPKMSYTEQAALSAGTTWWDRELFSGNPDWSVLDYDPRIKGLGISKNARLFLNGPVQLLCEMLDDYQISKDKDLPPEVWDFLKVNRFFGMVISEEYGGRGFNAREHSEVVLKIATRSIAAAVTVMVPNSLGPGELLHCYGTDEEKEKYLPRLASGKDIPCFALTGPTAGSDASSIPDVGIVVEKDGVLGLNLTFNKRFITLAPVASLMGLAIKVKATSSHETYSLDWIVVRISQSS
jgi:alkylation response protein AidB-like acyl-CoA dehydrogenase